MKKGILIILTLGLFLLTIVLGNYFNAKIQNDKIANVQVRIYPMEKTFILAKEVKKMIPVKDSIYKNVDIKKLEQQLEKNDYISNAEVFKDLNGHLKARIEQYHPIARVLSDKSYYIDDDGQPKALSKHYTENVILIFGKLNQKNKKPVIDLVKAINADKDLKAIVSEIHVGTSGVTLKTDLLNANINIDIRNNVKGQLYKLKAIYAYLVKNHQLNKYKNLDLRFANQVVCK
jgi:cell division protein FtsQ